MTSRLNRLDHLRENKKLALLASFLLGASVTLSFAPFNIWLFSILPLTGLLIITNNAQYKTNYWRIWSFALGFYATGTSWIYVSISGFGGAPGPLAALMVAIFSAFMAFFFSLPFYLFTRWLNKSPIQTALGFTASWVISEWLRTWLMTGFPWLFLGYAHLSTPLQGIAPVFGVIGISLVCVLSAAVLWLMLLPTRKSSTHLALVAISVCCWITGFALKNYEWTDLSQTPTSVVMVQPNVNQEDKWQTGLRESMLEQLKKDTEPHWGKDLIVWPEAAVTDVYSDALPFLNEVNHRATEANSGLVTGIIYDMSEEKYYNSLVTFGEALGIYHKRRLVPFGEYVPFEPLRNLIEFFNLPTSIISRGPEEQRGQLLIKEQRATALVCYEVAFPDLVASTARDSQFLLSVSNLGWFGDSLGRHQFLEMAQMRALETQRFHIYNTNNGPSAIINSHGKLITQSKAFTHTTLEGSFYGATGSTPYMKWTSWPVMMVSGLCLLICVWLSYQGRKE